MKSPRSRAKAVERVSAGLWEGTAAIVASVVAESALVPGWRPLRAALAAVERSPTMPAETFDRIAREAKLLAARSERGLLRDAIGASYVSMRRWRSGDLPAPPVVVLATAHWLLEMRAPDFPAEAEPRAAAFAAWFGPLFGSPERISTWLGLNQHAIPDRLRGFAMRSGERVVRHIEPELVRALDWTARVGPFSPFATAPLVRSFPERSPADDASDL